MGINVENVAGNCKTGSGDNEESSPGDQPRKVDNDPTDDQGSNSLGKSRDIDKEETKSQIQSRPIKFS